MAYHTLEGGSELWSPFYDPEQALGEIFVSQPRLPNTGCNFYLDVVGQYHFQHPLNHIQHQLFLLVTGLANSWESVGHTGVHFQPSISIPDCRGAYFLRSCIAFMTQPPSHFRSFCPAGTWGRTVSTASHVTVCRCINTLLSGWYRHICQILDSYMMTLRHLWVGVTLVNMWVICMCSCYCLKRGSGHVSPLHP